MHAGKVETKVSSIRYMDSWMDILLYFTSFLHIYISPYTKVEESFNLQACHDLISHGLDLDKYDHHQFPGVVPRSFIGPLVVSLVSSPFIPLLNLFKLDKFYSQYIVRGVLGFFVISAFISFKNSIQKRYGPNIGTWLCLLSISQFHFLFYASRPLPNIFALVLVLHAFSAFFSSNIPRFILISASAILIFRAELAGLLGFMLLIELIAGRTSIKEILKYGIISLLVFIPITVCVDSYFWGRTLWPELEVLYFNVVLNKSSDWGVLPFAWYFYSAIPRSLLSALFFIPPALVLDSRSVEFIFPSSLFIFLYSFLPHKELRFIIYTFPLLNAAAAIVLNYIWTRRGKNKIMKLLSLCTVGCLFVNMVVTSGLTYISSLNYPGGHAVHRLHSLLGEKENVRVHLDVFSCQTGISLFTQLNNNWVYDKTENLKIQELEDNYTHLLISGQNKYSLEMKQLLEKFEILEEIFSYDGLDIQPARFPPVLPRTKPSIYILAKK